MPTNVKTALASSVNQLVNSSHIEVGTDYFTTTCFFPYNTATHDMGILGSTATIDNLNAATHEG